MRSTTRHANPFVPSALHRAAKCFSERIPRTLFVAGLVFSAAIPSAAAQTQLVAPAHRQGYFIAGGVQGTATRSVDDDLGTLQTMAGAGVSVRFGEMVYERLGFALQIEAGSVESERWQQSHAAMLVDAQILLMGHLALHGAAGVGYAQATDKLERIDELTGTGGAYYSAGLTYDFFPFQQAQSGGWAITPSAFIKHIPGDAYSSTMFWAGVEVTWWRGLEKQRLELPWDIAFSSNE